MTETRKFICVACPVGCTLNVTLEDGVIQKVEGNSCARGSAYAEAEIANPTRVFASTLRIDGGALPVCPVRSRGPVPKNRVFEIAKAVAAERAQAPIRIGQVLLPNVCDTGVDIVASRDLAAGGNG
jgi:CxxC motif-containing protein